MTDILTMIKDLQAIMKQCEHEKAGAEGQKRATVERRQKFLEKCRERNITPEQLADDIANRDSKVRGILAQAAELVPGAQF